MRSLTVVLDKPVGDGARLMKRVESACRRLGHTPIWWSDDYYDRAGGPSGDKRPDVAVAWQSVADLNDCKTAAVLERAGVPVLHVDQGWLVPHRTFQMSWSPLGPLAPWAVKWKSKRAGGLPRRGNGDHALILLQDEADAAVKVHSPWLNSTADMVRLLLAKSPNAYWLWAPRGCPMSQGVSQLVREHPDRLLVVGHAKLGTYVRWAAFVATINSPYAAVAIQSQKPVLCFGVAAYRHKAIVYCMDGDPVRVAHVVDHVLHGAKLRERGNRGPGIVSQEVFVRGMEAVQAGHSEIQPRLGALLRQRFGE